MNNIFFVLWHIIIIVAIYYFSIIIVDYDAIISDLHYLLVLPGTLNSYADVTL